MPGDDLAEIRGRISSQYPSASYSDQIARVGTLIRDSCFTCNTRQLFDAYQGKIRTWMINYHFLDKYNASVHASDLLPTFCNDEIDVAKLLTNCVNVPEAAALIIGPYMRKSFAPEYQSYFKSHAIHDDPMVSAIGLAKKVNWTVATTSPDDGYNGVKNVLQPYYPIVPFIEAPFQMVDDNINTAESCNFWNDIAMAVMNVTGNKRDDATLKVQDVDSLSSVEL